jgi:anti-repressor protein
MNEIKIFSNPDFGQIRTVTVDGEPWLVGKDVAQALGYGDTDQAIRKHVDCEDKLTRCFDGSGQNRGMTVINESGLYSLILSSKLPGAKKFKHWVTSEVLPSIRRNGGYITGQNEMTDAELMAKAVLVAQKAIDERDRRIARLTEQAEEMRPKALFADAVAASGNSILIGELAKMLRQNGVDMGEKRLFGWMRENGYLIRRKGTDYNMPTQRSMEMGLFQIKETVVNHASGYTTVNKTPKVTGKGQTYFINKFLGKES